MDTNDQAWHPGAYESDQILDLLERETLPLDLQQRWLKALIHTTQVASSTLSIEEVLFAISREAIEALGAWGCNSFLFPERSKYGNYYMVEPLPPADYQVPDPPDVFTMEALQTGRVVMAEDALADPRTDKRTMEYFGIKSCMAFPLMFQGKAVAAGFVSYSEPHAFTEEDVQIAMSIGGAGALAVANAKLHATEVNLAVAEERNRIAQEMHDSVCQSLATIKLDLSTMLYTEQLEPEMAKRIEHTKTLVDQSYNDVRDIIHSFRVAGLQGDDFLNSMDDYIATFAARNDVVVVNDLQEHHVDLLNQTARLQVGRIVGEALNNVRKHAQASCVCLRTFDDGRAVWVDVEDDGVGFDPLKLGISNDGEHFGLAIMQERARVTGGALHVVQVQPHGTLVRAVIPYR